MDVRATPCRACPYRCDVPAGVWAADEYPKLAAYDAETWAQPPAGFLCHASPDRYCHGWAVVHSSRGSAYDLLALRFDPAAVVPDRVVPLFASGTDAAMHGLSAVDEPGPDALAAVERLLRDPRIRDHNTD
jgi:hypothetical protein